MPFGFNVITGKQDLKELPLRIVLIAPESTDLSNGEMIIYNDGVDKWLYWKTDNTVYKAKGTLA